MVAQRIKFVFCICLVVQAGDFVSSSDMQDFKCARAMSKKMVNSVGQFFNHPAKEINKEFDVAKFAKEQGFVQAAFYNSSVSGVENKDIFRNMMRSVKLAEHVFDSFHSVRSIIAKHAAFHVQEVGNAMDDFLRCSKRNSI